MGENNRMEETNKDEDLTVGDLMEESKKKKFNFASITKNKHFKLIVGCIIAVLILIVAFSLSDTNKGIESDLYEYNGILNQTNSIIANYKELGIELEYVDISSGSELNANFKNGDCNIKLMFDEKEQEFIGIELKDGGVTNEEYSSEYINTLEKTLDLSIYDMSLSSRNDIIVFFNENKAYNDNINGYMLSRNEDSITIKNKTDESMSNAIPITVDDIVLMDKKCYTDSIGTHYMEAKFKNKSDKIIKSITYTYNVDGEKNYLSSYDTLKPGDISTKSDTFGPTSNKFDDAELLETEISYYENDELRFIDYDAKLSKYSWY